MRIAVALVALLAVAADAEIRPRPGPRYTADGSLLRPDGVESWVLVGASLGLGYADRVATGGPGMFHNVYLEPSAYERYRRTGRFPDRTMLAMTMYQPAQKVPPSLSGWFEGEFAGLEVAVKDTARFAGGWAYFDFGRGGPGAAARPFPRESCQRCHAQHAARDNVFVQFYPVLRAADRN